MGAYYYIDSRQREKLYVPFNFIAVENSEIEIILSPGIISKHKTFLKKNKQSLERGLIAVVEIPNSLIKELQDYCFDNNLVLAEENAMKIFYIVTKDWRKMQVSRKWE